MRSIVKKARLYITACGLYEARFNGVRAGDFVLAPGHTDYRKRVQYQTIDVTGLLTDGENVLTVQLADGWYRGSCGAWGLKNQYGTETKLLAQLEITGADGSTETICTDGTWDWSNDGPIRFADNQDGEVYDGEAVPVYGGKARVTEHNVMLMYGKEASNREQEIDRQYHTIPNQRPKDKHRGNVYNLLFRHGKVRSQNMEKLKCSFPTTP